MAPRKPKPQYTSPASHADLPMAIASNHRRLHDHALAQGKQPSDYDPLIFFAEIMADKAIETDYRIVAGKTLLAYTEGPPPAIQAIVNSTSPKMRTINNPEDPQSTVQRKLAYDALLNLVTSKAPADQTLATDIADPNTQRSNPAVINHQQAAAMRKQKTVEAKLLKAAAKAKAKHEPVEPETITPSEEDIQ